MAAGHFFHETSGACAARRKIHRKENLGETRHHQASLYFSNAIGAPSRIRARFAHFRGIPPIRRPLPWVKNPIRPDVMLRRRILVTGHAEHRLISNAWNDNCTSEWRIEETKRGRIANK
jgi:hypothetical protein